MKRISGIMIRAEKVLAEMEFCSELGEKIGLQPAIFVMSFCGVTSTAMWLAEASGGREAKTGMANALGMLYGAGALGMGVDEGLMKAVLPVAIQVQTACSAMVDAWQDGLLAAGATESDIIKLSQGEAMYTYINKHLSLSSQIKAIKAL